MIAAVSAHKRQGQEIDAAAERIATQLTAEAERLDRRLAYEREERVRERKVVLVDRAWALLAKVRLAWGELAVAVDNGMPHEERRRLVQKTMNFALEVYDLSPRLRIQFGADDALVTSFSHHHEAIRDYARLADKQTLTPSDQHTAKRLEDVLGSARTRFEQACYSFLNP